MNIQVARHALEILLTIFGDEKPSLDTATTAWLASDPPECPARGLCVSSAYTVPPGPDYDLY